MSGATLEILVQGPAADCPHWTRPVAPSKTWAG
jgi:hypothetical protein